MIRINLINRKGRTMLQVDEIKSVIDALPEEDYIELRVWFAEKDWELWDRQIEDDSLSGKLDFLIEEAFEDKMQIKRRLNRY